MQRHPNWESLRKSLAMADPGYGGSAEMLAYLCKTYASYIPGEDEAMHFRCLYSGLTDYYFAESYEARQSFQALVKQDPVFDLSRAISLTSLQDSGNRTDAEIEFSRKTILEQAWWRPLMVLRIDRAFGRRLGNRFLADEIAILKFDDVKEALKYDPFNTSLMALVQNWIRLQSKYGSSEMTEDELSKFRGMIDKDFAFRRILASPYSVDHWNAFGHLQFDFSNPASLFLSDPYYQNGVVYSGDEDRALYGYLGKKAKQLSMLEDVMNREDHPKILPWKEYASTVDRSALLHCPFLRAYLLLKTVCEERQGKGYCRGEDFASFAPQLKLAQDDQNCDYLRTQSLKELTFKPVEVDLTYNPLEHWPAVD